MTDLISGAAVSLGGRVASKAAKDMTAEWRLARNVVASAKRRGVRVSQKQLKFALYDAAVADALGDLGEPSAQVRARLDEVEMTPPDRSNADLLLTLLREAFARQMSASDAQAYIHREIAIPVARLVARLDRSVEDIPTLSPVLLLEAQRLVAIDGRQLVDRLIRMVSTPTTRSQTLQDWITNRPTWLVENEMIDAWLGELAVDSDFPALGRAWLSRAIEAGATPRPYLKVRLATAWVDDVDDDETVSALSDVRGDSLVEAVLGENDLATRTRCLNEWAPASPLQEALKANLQAQQLLEARDLDGAIRVGRDAFDTSGFAGAGVVAAEALIQRSMAPGHQSSTSDIAAARDLVMRIRDSRRDAGVVAARSIRIAIHASMLLVDFAGARAMFTAAPDGSATADEARHPVVQEAAISALIQLGDIREATARVSERTPRQTVLQLQAREAELVGQDSRANELWSEAVDVQDDWSEKASLCFLLASRGVIHPFVEVLKPHNEEIAHDIEVIAHLNQRRTGSESRAEKLALDNPRVARALAIFYAEANRDRDSLRLAEQMARRWNDPDEWLRAARFHLRNSSYHDAIDRARTAFSVGGEVWGDRTTALRLQIAAMHDLRKWDDIVATAQVLLQIEPDAVDAGWSLIFAHHHSADDEQAFRTWKALPACRIPPGVGEASLWLHLYQLFGTDMAPISAVLDVIKRFPRDEQVRRLAIGAMLFAPIESADVEMGITELADSYHADFPDEAPVFWTLKLESEDPAEIIQALDRASGGRSGIADVEQRVLDGTFPLGLLALWAKRDYADALVRRRLAPRFAGVADGQPLNLEVMRMASERGVALDTSAALTLSALPEEIGTAIAKVPARILSTYRQLRDVQASVAHLKKSRGEFFPSTDDRGPWVHLLSVEEEIEQARLLADIEARLRLAERSDPPVLTTPIPGLQDIFGPWTEAICRASEASVPLWCDDAATRGIAEALGVSAFGTPELVEYLRIEGQLEAATADAFDGALIHAHLVGIRYRQTSWTLALSLDGYQPAGTAQALLFGGPLHVAEKLQLVFDALRHNTDDPDALSRWGNVAVKYLTNMTTSDPQAVENLSLLLRGLLAASWLAPHQFAFVARGARESAADRWYPALRSALSEHWLAIRRVVEPDVGAAFIVGQVNSLSEEERLLALEVVMRDAT